MRKWFKLFAAIGLIAIFIVYIAPLISTIPGMKEMTESNRKNGIDAKTLFYTETEQFNSTSNYMTNINREN